jgi:hypothetical protein
MNKYKGKLYCFSPPVMVATCIIEVSLLIYTLWRYRLNQLTRLVAIMLVTLATFQLAEFHVCRGTSGLAQWSHLGYIAITLLPPVGIHILYTIKKQKDHLLVYASYATALVFVAIFALTANSLTGHQCLGNYVMFQVNPRLTDLYGIYYYGWVLIGVALSLDFAHASEEKRMRQALYGFALGYAAFLVPTTTANLLDKATLRGIPSIMCGFAVILAIVTVAWVMPRVGLSRKQ